LFNECNVLEIIGRNLKVAVTQKNWKSNILIEWTPPRIR